jgi:geranylgeranyl diphosphate synthase type II
MTGPLASVEAALNRWLPAESAPPESIHKAMRYSVFAGGKRIRPLLALASAAAVSDSTPGIEDAASTIEMIHTYSLIHDDLPDMDNDDFRRGRLTCHKMFGNAIAILAGDALCTLAFQVLASLECVGPEIRTALIGEIALAAGTNGGMIAGQVHDIESEGLQPNGELLRTIHRAKTGALLRASVRMGAIYAGAQAESLAGLTEYGERIGLAFQIVDDILDVEETSEVLGKTAGKDAAQHKMTFPAVYGIAEAKLMAQAEKRAALEAIADFDRRADGLREIAARIVDRRA